MTVKELMAMLGKMDPEATVMVSWEGRDRESHVLSVSGDSYRAGPPRFKPVVIYGGRLRAVSQPNS